MSPNFSLPNGVRARRDDHGDRWAQEHRTELGRDFHMQDLDGFIGLCAFAQNTQDALFVEYIPDQFKNRAQSIRQFGLVAFFDRKSNEETAFGPANLLCTAVYLHLCRTIGAAQPYPPRFFYVVGHEPPWTMIELDIQTGQETNRWEVKSGNWKTIWEISGLHNLRKQLNRWLKGEKNDRCWN